MKVVEVPIVNAVEELKIEPLNVQEEKEPEKVAAELNKRYEDMSVEELQEVILEKMRRNGPVTDYMLGTVRENIYHDLGELG